MTVRNIWKKKNGDVEILEETDWDIHSMTWYLAWSFFFLSTFSKDCSIVWLGVKYILKSGITQLPVMFRIYIIFIL